jgi:hypothetical protein
MKATPTEEKIAQPILRKKGIGTAIWEGAKPIMSGELKNEYRISNWNIGFRRNFLSI